MKEEICINMNIKMDVEALLNQGLTEEDILKSVAETVKKNVAETKKKSLDLERQKAKTAAIDKITDGFTTYFDVLSKNIRVPKIPREKIQKEIEQQFNELESMVGILNLDRNGFKIGINDDDDILRKFLNKLR